MINFYISKREK